MQFESSWLNAISESLTKGWTVRKECRALTLRSWIVAACLLLATLVLLRGSIYPFLATTQPAQSGILVVEGWLSEHFYKEVAELCRNSRYRRVLIVLAIYDGDLYYDSAGLAYDDYIRWVAVQQGVPADRVHVVLGRPTRRDRTFHTARLARRWLAEHEPNAAAVDVATEGPHARRSRLLYQKAFGDRTRVGVIALTEQTYDPDRWWQYSSGIRDVFSETIAYIHTLILFRPPDPPDDDTPFVIPRKSESLP
ncbi:MAG: hypothetical protein IH602_04755 [Bryobacteraceae bacterium]|nr:hypothetical protein [Bryobacteraceae bacterium]